MNREELIVMYALVLASRPHTDYKATIDAAFNAADYLLKRLQEDKQKCQKH